MAPWIPKVETTHVLGSVHTNPPCECIKYDCMRKLYQLASFKLRCRSRGRKCHLIELMDKWGLEERFPPFHILEICIFKTCSGIYSTAVSLKNLKNETTLSLYWDGSGDAMKCEVRFSSGILVSVCLRRIQITSITEAQAGTLSVTIRKTWSVFFWVSAGLLTLVVMNLCIQVPLQSQSCSRWRCRRRKSTTRLPSPWRCR